MARILVVDDEPPIRFLLRCALEGVGHEVEEAEDGLEGVRLFRQQPADLVITDIFMAGKEGPEAMRELRRDYPSIKIIAISGSHLAMGPENALQVAQALRAIRVLEKPLNMKEFFEAVEEALKSCRMARRSLPAYDPRRRGLSDPAKEKGPWGSPPSGPSSFLSAPAVAHRLLVSLLLPPASLVAGSVFFLTLPPLRRTFRRSAATFGFLAGEGRQVKPFPGNLN